MSLNWSKSIPRCGRNWSRSLWIFKGWWTESWRCKHCFEILNVHPWSSRSFLEMREKKQGLSELLLAAWESWTELRRFVMNSRDSHLNSENHSLNIVRPRDRSARSGFVLQDCNCNLLTTKNDFPASSQVVVDCKRVFRNTICSFSFVINYLSTS